jgi:hypothetical protein
VSIPFNIIIEELLVYPPLTLTPVIEEEVNVPFEWKLILKLLKSIVFNAYPGLNTVKVS